MKMKLFATLAIFINVLVTNVTGQPTQRQGEKTKDTIITLLQNNDSAKTVILLQTDKYVVKTSLSNLKENFGNWVSQHLRITDDKILIKLIIDASENNTGVDVEKIANENKLLHTLNYILADMIEKGKCFIIGQADGKIITTIRIQTYSYNCGPLCGNGGRRFFINDILLFKVIDWLS